MWKVTDGQTRCINYPDPDSISGAVQHTKSPDTGPDAHNSQMPGRPGD